MPKQIANKKPKIAGFSLLELSVVLVIIGIIIYMLLAVTTAQLEQGRIKTTQDKLIKIQNALIVFYGINNRLPCPANGLALNTDSAYGKEQASTDDAGPDSKYGTVTCTANLSDVAEPATTVYIGTIPTRSLGLSDDIMVDSWGGRFTYAVSKHCVDPDNWSLNNTYKCSNQFTVGGVTTGAITVDGDSISILGPGPQTWPVNTAYIVISHGKDQIGAYNRAGNLKQGTAGSSLPENVNANYNTPGNVGLVAGIGNTSYYDLPINNGDIPGNYYDDLTIWNTAPQIYYYANH